MLIATRPRYRPKRIGTIKPTAVKTGDVRLTFANYPFPKPIPNSR